jgi:hypothetical protein
MVGSKVRPPRRALAFAALQLAACALVAAAAFFAGQRLAVAPLRAKAAAFAQGESLGELLDPDAREAAALAYFDPQAARAGLDDYSWTVPNVMTPFVGNGAAPGTHHNASINYWQCRSPRQIRTPKPGGVLRVFLTGGSTAYGSGASSDAQTIGALLEAQLNEQLPPGAASCEVFAFANPAWASTHERIAIENRISELEPDLVVSLSGMNDIRWGNLRRNVLWFRSYADDIWFSLVNDVLALLGEEPMPDVAWLEPAPVPAATVAERLAKNVRLGWHALAPAGVPYLFCLQPALPVSKKALTARERSWGKDAQVVSYYEACCRGIRERLTGLTGELERFHFLDLVPIFDGLGEADQIFLDSFHFGDRGNARIAAAICAAAAPLLRAGR